MPKLTSLLFVLFIHKLIDVILVLAHPSFAEAAEGQAIHYISL